MNFKKAEDYRDTVASSLTNFPEALINLFRTKSILWSYEKEIRIVIFKLKHDKDNRSFVKFKKEAINEVYLGSKIKPDDEQNIISICKREYPWLKIFKMQLADCEFKLIPRSV